MPRFTIGLPQKAVDKLQAEVTRTNENNGTNLTLQQWITLHLKEVAIAAELTAAVQAIHEQQQRDAQDTLQAAITAERDRLIQNL